MPFRQTTSAYKRPLAPRNSHCARTSRPRETRVGSRRGVRRAIVARRAIRIRRVERRRSEADRRTRSSAIGCDAWSVRASARSGDKPSAWMIESFVPRCGGKSKRGRWRSPRSSAVSSSVCRGMWNGMQSNALFGSATPMRSRSWIVTVPASYGTNGAQRPSSDGSCHRTTATAGRSDRRLRVRTARCAACFCAAFSAG